MRRALPLNALRWFTVWFVSVVVAVAAETTSASALPFVHPVFGDAMVMQRGKPNVIWGWADPGQTVRVSIAGKSAEGRAGADRKWSVTIEPPPVGGPYELTIEGPERVVLRDVRVGDVWLCSGQSNMAVALRGAKGGVEEAKTADVPEIRLFAVAQRSAYGEVDVVRGQWRVCTPETAPGFSAVAYFFARAVHREIGVPIGLIQSAVGGSPVESWMSADAVVSTGEFKPQVAEIARLHQAGVPETGSFLMHWLAEHDAGGKEEAWAQSDFDDRAWEPVQLGEAFATLGVPATPSVVWFRREIELPDPLPAGNARLQLGQVEKMDTAYVNGRWVGASSWVENPRNYAIPAGVLKPGRNTIAVRVFKLKPQGGFIDGPDAVRLQFGPPAEATRIPLGDGAWKAKVSVDARPPHALPLDLENYPTMPVVLYNGMIEPLAPLAITGALWYQGEANFTRAGSYQKLLTALIGNWRDIFRAPDMPVYVVSLPAFMQRRETPGSDGWTEVRDAQVQTARSVPHTGVVVTTDVGDASNIHPNEKRPVGERLAAVALAEHYGKKIPHEGPTYRGMEKVPGGLRVMFDHTDGGLEVRGDTLGEFAVAGDDGVWHWAQAKIDGESVVVSSSAVPNPTAVSYAWQANPLATLFNGAGFPAVPFRTDRWKPVAK